MRIDWAFRLWNAMLALFYFETCNQVLCTKICINWAAHYKVGSKRLEVQTTEGPIPVPPSIPSWWNMVIWYFQLNASGVLIYDNQGDGGDLMAIPSVDLSSDTSSVGSRGDDDAIPLVFTYNFKGEEIVNLVRRYNRVLLKLHKSAHCRR